LEENKTKNILVTGGAGFIGSHLCKALLDLGHNVICLDNLFTGSINNISDLIDNTNFEFVNHDIIKPYYRENIDEIYNLACPASPIHYQYNPIKTIKTCTIGVINILGLAKKNNAKILQASTSEVYGDPKTHPQSENYNGNVNPIGPRSCYDEGKRCSEALFMDYHRKHNLKIKIIRIFNTYGPNMANKDGRVISNFILQAIMGNKLTINGDGTQTRSFQYIDDLVEAMIKMMNTNDRFTGPVNIGNPIEISMNKLAYLILELTNSKSEIIYKDLPMDDPKRRNPEISLANDKLNWIPLINLEDGLIKTIEYFKKLNEIN
jgi:UDP-glucuronate decarboxylase